jgi:hypothetical protein
LSSIREQVLETMKVALGGVGTPAAGGVFRSHLDQIAPQKLPSFDITPGEEKIEDPGEFGDEESITRTLLVMVRALVDAGDAEGEDEDPTVQVDDSALDPFYVFAIQQLTGNAANLSNHVENIREIGTTAVFRPEGRDILGLEMTFEVTYATKRGDPTQRG